GSTAARPPRRRARPAIPSTSESRASVVRRRRVWSQHLADGRFDDPDLDALGDFDLGLLVADLGDPAADASAGDHIVTLLDRRDRRLVLLHLLLLRAD